MYVFGLQWSPHLVQTFHAQWFSLLHGNECLIIIMKIIMKIFKNYCLTRHVAIGSLFLYWISDSLWIFSLNSQRYIFRAAGHMVYLSNWKKVLRECKICTFYVYLLKLIIIAPFAVLSCDKIFVEDSIDSCLLIYDKHCTYN